MVLPRPTSSARSAPFESGERKANRAASTWCGLRSTCASSHGAGELLDAVDGTALGQLVGEVLGVVVGEVHLARTGSDGGEHAASWGVRIPAPFGAVTASVTPTRHPRSIRSLGPDGASHGRRPPSGVALRPARRRGRVARRASRRARPQQRPAASGARARRRALGREARAWEPLGFARAADYARERPASPRASCTISRTWMRRWRSCRRSTRRSRAGGSAGRRRGSSVAWRRRRTRRAGSMRRGGSRRRRSRARCGPATWGRSRRAARRRRRRSRTPSARCCACARRGASSLGGAT